MGQRIRKTGYGVSTGTNRFIYDAQGHLLGDYAAQGCASAVGAGCAGAANSRGVAIQETVYLGDIPVAVLQDTAVYNLHANHLNTPRVITDNTNKVIWRWDSDPFGTTLANEDPDNNGVKFTYNLRFPGQYFDKETGLHYNYFRDYDPRIGRYVQSDPIGLAGGLNTYTYAVGTSISNFDPDGLRVCYALYCEPVAVPSVRPPPVNPYLNTSTKEPWEFPSQRWQSPGKCETEEGCWKKARNNILQFGAK